MSPPEGKHGRYLCVLEVVAPERADLILASDVPHGEVDVLVLDRLHVEALSDKQHNGDGNEAGKRWKVRLTG